MGRVPPSVQLIPSTQIPLKDEAMRVLVGASAVLGVAVAAVTVAVAQPPVRDRAVEFKAPQALYPTDPSAVARGASDDLPSGPYLSSTPVPRSFPPARSPGVAGPAGADPNVRPAAWVPTDISGGTLPPARPADQTAPVPPKMFDRIKGYLSGDRPPAARPDPHAVIQAEPPTASTPFRGTGANGAPVYAGPPAYRWYGWGTVTPGANPFAPAGQYPRASANWYAITGATPGAFPVPVTNPQRWPPGTEPPTYGLRAQPGAQPGTNVAAQPQQYPQRAPAVQEYQDPSRIGPAVGTKFTPAPAPSYTPPPEPAPVSVPTITTPPGSRPVVVAPPTVPQPDLPVAGVEGPAVPPPPAQPGPELTTPLPAVPVPVVPPVPTVAPTKPITPVATTEPVKFPPVEPKPTTPAPLPSSVTEYQLREEMRWQRNTEPIPPLPGSWSPAPGMTPLPTTEPQGPTWPVGRAKQPPVVARGQLNDNAPDTVATLIKQVCTGRAEAVEVRWTGAKKLSVCFEIRTPAAAQKLVAEISKRSELAAYQIDFCVLVK
jgi:hypothetical protein